MTDQDASCTRCPAFLSRDEAEALTGKDIGSPMCKAKGIPLLMPKDVDSPKEQILLEIRATDCDLFQKPTSRTLHSTFNKDSGVGMKVGVGKDTVGLGMPGIGKAGTPAKPVSNLSTCRTCSQFVTAADVVDRVGWTGVGMCLAKGELIRVELAAATAAQCVSPLKSSRVDAAALAHGQKTEHASLDNFEFDMMYGLKKSVLSQGEAVQDLDKVDQSSVDPREYETDLPVEKEFLDAGIRAWRRIPNPQRPEQFVHLAIYNHRPISEGGFLSDEELSKVPQAGQKEHVELYQDYSDSLYRVAVAWLELGETPIAWGEPGVGKTELFRWIAWLMQLPFERMSITATTEVDDLMGNKEFSPEKGTYYRYGRLPLAWKKPCIIVLDEPNVGPDEVWHALRPLTDNSSQLVLEQAREGGERLDRHDDCYLGFAANPAWDVRNAGANSIADADSSRLMHVFIELPDKGTEMKIIQNAVEVDGWQLDPNTLDQIMVVAEDLRELSKSGALPISWGIRHQIKFARGLKYFTPVDAMRMAAADFLDPVYRDQMLDIVRATMAAQGKKAAR